MPSKATFTPNDINRDLPAVQVPEDAWTAGSGINFRDGITKKQLGELDFGINLTSITPVAIWNSPGSDPEGSDETANYWLIAGPLAGGLETPFVFLYDGTTLFNINSAIGTEGPTISNDYCWSELAGQPVLSVDHALLSNGNVIPSTGAYWPRTYTGAVPDNIIALPTPELNTVNPRVLRAHRYHLFALGGVFGGVTFQNFYDQVWWSSAIAPGSDLSTLDWTPTTGNDAGDITLADTPGEIIDGLSFGSRFFVFKQNATHVFDYVGGSLGFANRKVSPNIGMMSRNCGAVIKDRFVVLTADDVIISDGYKFASAIDARNRNYLFSNMQNPDVAFVRYYRAQNELWVCYDASGDGYCNRALVWDVKADKWGLRKLPEISDALSGFGYGANVSAFMGVSGVNQAFVEFDTSPNDWEQLPYSATFEKSDITLGDPDSTKTITRIWPRYQPVDATDQLLVEVYAKNDINSAYVLTASEQFDSAVAEQKVDVFGTGKFFRIVFTQNAQTGDANSFTMSGFDIEYESRGRF